MSALTVAEATCVCGSEHLCACGCGESLSPHIRRTHELDAAGAKTAAIAEILGVSTAYVKSIKNGRAIPRFVRGHSAKAWKYEIVPCAGCGKPFTKMGPQHIYCTSSAQRHGNPKCKALHWEQHQTFWADHDAGVAEREAARAAVSADRRRWQKILRRETDADWLVAQRAAAAEGHSGELADLVAEQQREEEWGHLVSSRFVRSLDQPFADSDFTFGDLLGDEGSDPELLLIDEEYATEIRKITGGRTEEELRRLDSYTLSHIGRQLLDARLVHINVLHDERHRLREKRKLHNGQRMTLPERAAMVGGWDITDFGEITRGRKRTQKLVRDSQKAAKRYARSRRWEDVEGD